MFQDKLNFKFLSKIIEKALATQLIGHLINNILEEPFQSACKIKVQRSLAKGSE